MVPISWTTPRTWVAGEVVTAAIGNTHWRDNLTYLHDVGPALTYTANTPALTASSSNPTLGSGSSANGRYIQIGKLVHYYGRIVFGSSGVAAGSGNYRISLPINWSASIGDDTLGIARIFDSSAGAQASMLCRFNGVSATFFELWYGVAYPSGAQAVVGDALPWTWAANDELHWAVTYEGV